MVINTNISATNSARMLAQSSANLATSLARLSSGSKLVNPQDDAAGSAVSMRFDAQIGRVEAANNNVASATSFTQTQTGFLQKVAGALSRMSELSIAAQDVTKSNSDRALYDKEFQTLGQYINDVASKTFNGVSLFSSADLTVTVNEDGGTFAMSHVNMGTGTAYKTATDQNVLSTSAATTALSDVTSAINQLSTDLATVGANAVRLSYTSDQLSVLQQNLTAANSQIKDVDIADESTNYAKYNILVQAGTAMLAQANTVPQSMLKLLS
ncbi:MAG TPA: flagellin [Verrucomicrobiae bacterium]|nr:flagellin [Verrucomicrobiae bacterium]